MSPPETPRPVSQPPDLVLTGERTLPGIADERYWFERHVVAYRVASEQLSGGEVVLDAGCGEGYGLAMLADAGAQRVIGADLDPTVVDHVDRNYAATDPRIEAVGAELSALPLADDEVAVAVSFQVIEHLHDVPGYLASLRRVTRPGGRIWIATPNRLTFTPGRDTPVNPFHVREFTATELYAELEGAGLRVTAMQGVHHGPRLRALTATLGRPFLDAVLATPPEGWAPELRAAVHATTVDDFEVRDGDLDASLDLIAVARVP